jgi:hypothetical protein
MTSEFKISRLRYTWAGAWAPAVDYNRDAVVSFNGKTWVCLEPHTSSVFEDELNFSDPTLGARPRWSLMIDGKTWRGNWAPATAYYPGNIVLYRGTVYLAVTFNTSGLSFNSNNWTTLALADKWNPSWGINTTYGIGDVVKYGATVYRCIVNHVSAGTITAGLETDQNKWEVVYRNIEYKGLWSPTSVRYRLNDIVSNGSDLWICIAGHTSNSTFNQTVWSLWVPGIDFKTTWQSNAVYQPGDTVTYGGYSYISVTANNQDNIPSTNSNPQADPVDPWKLLTEGYEFQNDWESSIEYKVGDVVRRGGTVFVAKRDNSSQDPVATSITVVYDDDASSGRTLVVDDTTGIVPGMVLLGSDFTLGQYVSEVIDETTLLVSDGPLTELGSSVTFVGVDSTNWDVLVTGTRWAGYWRPTPVDQEFVVGDIVVWKNATYRCLQNHTVESGTRPDLDTTNQYWTVYVLHDRRNATETVGDLVVFSAAENKSIALPIGEPDLNLRRTDDFPAWREILVIEKVYYVTNVGTDDPTYGKSIDKPWKTIRYACQQIARGDQYVNAGELLDLNKDFIANEVYEYLVSQAVDTEEYSTKRDSRYVVDALAYDLARGGNSQTVAATLAYFSLKNNDTFINSAVDAQMPTFLTALAYLRQLVGNVLIGSAPTTIYQELNSTWSNSNSYSEDDVVFYNDVWYTSLTNTNSGNQPDESVDDWSVITTPTTIKEQQSGLTAEEDAAAEADSLLFEILIDALTNQTKRKIPPPNLKATATVFVKTGTYDEILPIVVPANTAIVGDELRSTVVRPAGAFYTETYSALASTNSFVLANTADIEEGMPVQFIGSRAFGDVTIGQTYWIYSVTPTGFSISETEDLLEEKLLTNGVGEMRIIGGMALSDMFYFQNGSGMRNLTLTGLGGTLTALNEYFTRRPTGGAYTSLDPGRGPDDTRAWIYRRSPYIQNVTTFGQGCVGCKIDGNLHNGGNRSMVSNDFTQILSDGIGVWCTGEDSLTECVSVFSYYNYCGYLAEDGGRIRATNGNSSYGVYGVIAEGFVESEIPIAGNVFNRSSQIQASVQSSFGSNAQLVKVQYANAGSEYNTQTTNLLRYSNDFVNGVWVSDGSTTLFQNTVAPNGDSIGWTLNGLTSGSDTAYLYQDNTILPTGATYTGVGGTNISGSGINATFNIIVTSTSYIVSVNFGGTGYVVNNQILIPGLLLGGVSGINDCIITVSALAGSTITAVTSSGTVPAGSTTNYVLSLFVKQATASEIDLYAIFTGNNDKYSGVTFNFADQTLTKFSSTGGGNEPSVANFVELPNGWFRVWFVVNDADGLNDNLQYRIYPRGRLGNTGSTAIFGAQVTVGTSLTFYLGTKDDRYNAYANYYITGAGINGRAIGNEIRSGSIFQTRVLDLGLGVGGRGYLTASNNAQSGDEYSITLAGSDINTAANYIGMRLFVNSGTGAGQYGLISSFSESTKVATVTKETYDPVSIESTSSSTDEFALAAGQDTETMYVGQPVQFVPTYYNTTVIESSIESISVTEILGGVDSQIIIPDTRLLKLNMAISFKGTTFGGVTEDFTYYVKEIISSTNFTISTQQSGNLWPLNTSTGNMTLLYPSNTGFLTGDTVNMTVNQPISFTGAVIGGIEANTTYYINRVVDENKFTISETLLSATISSTNATTGVVSVDTTSGFSSMNPIVFTGNSFGGIVPKQTYWINTIVNGTSFTLADDIIEVTATETAAVSNLITVSSTAGFQANNPIKFTGNAFGNLVAETVYYILAINDATTFTVSAIAGGSTVTLTSAEGSMITRTPGTTTTVTNDAGSMVATTTTGNLITSKQEGTMVGTFFSELFGGISQGSEYYVLTVNSNSFSITDTPTGTVAVQLTSDTGSMRVTESGWDHINPGTDIPSLLDSSSVYFIEPTITYTPPPFSQIAGGALPVLGSGNYWKSMAYGNGYWLAFPENNNIAARTQDGLTWTSVQLTSNEVWGDVAFGNNYWVAISDQGAGANSKALYSSSNGDGWREVDLPGNRSWSKITYGNGIFVTIAKYVPEDVLGGVPAINAGSGYSTNFGGSWTAGTGLTTTDDWVGLAYGAGTNQTIFVAISSTGSYAISSTGATWTVGSLPTPASGTFTPAEIVFGNGRFVVVTGGKTAYSLNGSNWKLSNLEITADKISYGQGVFVAIDSANGLAWTSEDGFSWVSQTVSADNYNKILYGIQSAINTGKFITLGELTISSVISAGAKPKGRATIVSGTIPRISMWETGSNYGTGSIPTVTIFDPNILVAASVQPRLGSGALGNPTWVNRGEGYNTTSTSIEISGDGYADQYQTGFTLIVNNLTKLPSPGDNLEITGNSQVYKVTSASAQFGTVAPNIEANLQISPELVVANSPAHNTALSIRQKYSQVRLTNHDFLSIGFGNEAQTNYPSTPEDTVLAPQDQTVETNNGRVFYTSSDQDGNFKVGNLFAVEQATGIITISATQFGLSGLDELRLGGIAVGGSSVIIRQFSTDPTFVANSNEILSTQKSIKAYLSSRLSQGGSNTFTGELIAGTVRVGGPDKIQSTVPAGVPGSSIKIPVRASFQGPLAAVGGDAVALAYFMKTFWRR